MGAPVRTVLDRTRQAAPQILDVLRERILALELAPGAAIARGALMTEFGLSQTPVRDALMRLEEEGLVAVFPQSGTRVTRIDLDAARQTHILRGAAEAEAAALVAGDPPADVVATLTRRNAALAECAAAGDLGAFLRADRAFHETLFDAAGLMRVWSSLRRQSGHVDRLRRLNLPDVGTDRVVHTHAAIIAAIAARDPAAASAAMREHLSATLSQLPRIAARYPDWVERAP